MSQLVDSVDVVYQDAILRRINRMLTILVQADPAPGVIKCVTRLKRLTSLRVMN